MSVIALQPIPAVITYEAPKLTSVLLAAAMPAWSDYRLIMRERVQEREEK